MTNGPIYLLPMNAFQPQNREIVGAPSWGEHGTIRLPCHCHRDDYERHSPPDAAQPAGRPLKLRASLEPREQPVYFLVTAQTDRRLGPQIEPTTRDCASVQAADRAGLPRPAGHLRRTARHRAAFITALREQLGLRLETGRAPLQTLAIEHIERPSEN